jgi:hypothetical protein
MSFRPHGWRCASPTTARAQRERDRCGGERSRTAVGAIVDLACGTGSTFARSSPRIKARQNWRLVDNDLSLLARTPQSSPPDITSTTADRSQPRSRSGARRAGRSRHHLGAARSRVGRMAERLAVEAAARRLPVYAALSYDGRIEMTPGCRRRWMIAAVNAHQRTDKGLARRSVRRRRSRGRRFERVGYAVVHGAADWLFGRRIATSSRDAVGLGRGGARDRRRAADRRRRWLTRRRDLVAAGRSSIRVGHVDLFARPTGTR